MCKHIQCIKDDRWPLNQLEEKLSKHLVHGEGENFENYKSMFIHFHSDDRTGTPYLNYKFEAIRRGASLNNTYIQSIEKELHDNHMNHIYVAPT